ncbi:MAG TPA: hypothetical protein VEC06_09900 [Paucimonas sp.]|nr:hypothetical protein [Paucimonas sp.]
MTISSLDPGLDPRPDRRLGVGHGTDALGPSDTSDSGSDVCGGPGLKGEQEVRVRLGGGTTSDLDQGPAKRKGAGNAGPDIGDANLDSDTDSGGTGEHRTAGRDATISDGQDIDVDQIQRLADIPDEQTMEDRADEEFRDDEPPPEDRPPERKH